MARIVAALLRDPAILALHVELLTSDVVAVFHVDRRSARAAVMAAFAEARDAGLWGPGSLPRSSAL